MFSLEQNTYKNARLGDTDFTDAELRGYTCAPGERTF